MSHQHLSDLDLFEAAVQQARFVRYCRDIAAQHGSDRSRWLREARKHEGRVFDLSIAAEVRAEREAHRTVQP